MSPPCLGGVDVVVGNWGAGGDAWAFATRDGCWIAVRPTVYPAPSGVDQTWWRTAMCVTIAHEWGHILGRGHSSDPHSLMYPQVPLESVAGCAPGAPPPPGLTSRRRARVCRGAARKAAPKRRCVRRSARSHRARVRAR
jgi:hypothetical protein